MKDDREPDSPSPVAHVIDVLTFRAAGAGLIVWEVAPQTPAADWKVVAAGFAMFFMPDALRGRGGIVWMALGRFFKLDETQEKK